MPVQWALPKHRPPNARCHKHQSVGCKNGRLAAHFYPCLLTEKCEKNLKEEQDVLLKIILKKLEH